MVQYLCSSCQAKYSIGEFIYRCSCGAPLDLIKRVYFPLSQCSSRPATMWRYREAIPIAKRESIISLGEGMTPLIDLEHPTLDLKAKLDFINPTGSFKDRGASVFVSFVKEIGVDHFVEDSSGNAGAAIAAYGARAGLSCEIFCPEYASLGKLVQAQLCGAKLYRIPGTRADTARVVLERAKSVYYASHNWNPFFLEGIKTLAYEIVEQIKWQPPDNVICPLGYGGLLLGLRLGFKELLEWKIVDRMPRLFGVQPAVCAPIAKAFTSATNIVEPVRQTAPTIAEGICAGNPPRGQQVLDALAETKGAVTTVTEKEIKEGLWWLGSQGLFVEPTSAVVVKGLSKFLKNAQIHKGETTVMILTGSGLKATYEIQRQLLT